MNQPIRSAAIAVFVSSVVMFGWGCVPPSPRDARRDGSTVRVGVFPPPPPGITKARVGVPRLEAAGEGLRESLGDLAADRLATLAFLTGRFDVIDRAELERLLEKQGLAGMVKGADIVRRFEVEGIDFLLLGKVIDPRVTINRDRWHEPAGGPVRIDHRDLDLPIVLECGVDLLLVDPATGKPAATCFGESRRVGTLASSGITVIGVEGGPEDRLAIPEEDEAKVVRVALDDILKRMLPSIDALLVARARAQKA